MDSGEIVDLPAHVAESILTIRSWWRGPGPKPPLYGDVRDALDDLAYYGPEIASLIGSTVDRASDGEDR